MMMVAQLGGFVGKGGPAQRFFAHLYTFRNNKLRDHVRYSVSRISLSQLGLTQAEY